MDNQTSGQVANLADTEFEVRAAVHRVGSVVVEQLLNADHGGHRGARIDCPGGHQGKFVDYRTKQVQTIMGVVRVRRAYYHCADCPKHDGGMIPKDQELDIVATSFSPGMRRLMSRVGAQEAFDAARQDLVELAGVAVQTKAIERISEAVGMAAEAANQADRALIESVKLADRALIESVKLAALARPARLYVAIDGTGVPALPKETLGRVGKAGDGKAKTREAKLGCVFTQTNFDAQGWPIRDAASTSYVGAIESAEQFGPRISCEAQRRGAHRAKDVIFLGDGAPWIWNLAEVYFPEATQILDLFHAREHLATVGQLAFGSSSAPGNTWVAARRDDLDNSDVDLIVTEIEKLRARSRNTSVRDALRKEAQYFETNKLRMCYKHFRARGLFVGSGVVEAGCKTVIGQRLKHSGMRWSVTGANAIIALRCRLLSHRWDDLWRAAA